MASELRKPEGELAHRLSSSKKYWQTDGKEGAPLVMPGADLKRLDLREQILVGAQLQGADLRGSFLDSALLVRAALDGARMAGASLYSTDASKATLAQAQLAGAQAPRSIWRRTTLTAANFAGALLDDCDFTGADLLSADLSRASVVRADFSKAMLLAASFRKADITMARFTDAVADAHTLAGSIGSALVEPVIGPPTTPRRRNDAEREFETTVIESLQRHDIDVFSGLRPGPDLVVQLPGEWFAAIEVSATIGQRRLFSLAERADLIVVPDGADVRLAMNNTPVAHLHGAPEAIRQLPPSRLKPHGATALLAREAARLQPYVALAERAKANPAFMSQLSVYLDTRERFLLGESDRRFAEQLPAHLGGDMPARGAAWAERHADELRQVLSQSARLQRGVEMDTETVTVLARLAWRLEHELAEAIQPKR